MLADLVILEIRTSSIVPSKDTEDFVQMLFDQFGYIHVPCQGASLPLPRLQIPTCCVPLAYIFAELPVPNVYVATIYVHEFMGQLKVVAP